MLPVFTFASGLRAGVIGIRLLKTAGRPGQARAEQARAGSVAALHDLGEKARQGFDKAETGLRQAAVSSLEAIEKSSASLRDKLTPSTPEKPAAETSDTVAEAVPPAAETSQPPAEAAPPAAEASQPPAEAAPPAAEASQPPAEAAPPAAEASDTVAEVLPETSLDHPSRNSAPASGSES